MLEELIAEDIKLIHLELEKQFPLMLKGVQKEGLIQAAIERQSITFQGSNEIYENIFTKAAALMEALTRWHTFNDGNKRTGLLSTFLYLYLNEHYLAIPIDAVRFTQKIAATQGTDQDTINKLIKEISIWLEKYTSKDYIGFSEKVWKYTFKTALKLTILNIFGFKKRVKKQLEYWFAVKEHPEYKVEMKQVYSFLIGLMFESFVKIVVGRNEHPKVMKLKKLDSMRCAIAEHEFLVRDEDKLYNSVPDEKGLRRIYTTCVHCKKKIGLETDPKNENEYFFWEENEE